MTHQMILGYRYAVIDCPHPLKGTNEFWIDHTQLVIWLRPSSPERRALVVAAAVRRVQMEALGAVRPPTRPQLHPRPTA